MKFSFLALLPVLLCAPCLAVSLGVAGVVTAGLVTATGLLTTPGGIALTIGTLVAGALGVRQFVLRRRACPPPLSEGGRR